MMKRLLFFFCAVILYSAQTWGQTYNPSDIAVINAMIDNNGLKWTKANPADGSYAPADWTDVIWSSDATGKSITELKISYKSLSGSLTVSNLKKLTSLDCSVNRLSKLDVSNLTQLSTLKCDNNQLTKLDVSTLKHLKYFFCSYNLFSTLDVSNLSELTSLDCGGNQLSSIDVSKLTQLTSLNCRSNQLSSIDISNLPQLTSLDCSNNQILSLDVSNLPQLKNLYCDSNFRLSSLDISNSTQLTVLSCSNGQLSSLDVSNLPQLTSLDCSNNQLSSLDVSNSTQLTFLHCQYNQLSTLGFVSNLTQLEDLYCNNNQLSSLDVSNSTQLKYLYCNANQLSTLGVVSNLTQLKHLYCNDNQLSSLDVSNSTQLIYLMCANNRLSSLDVSNSTQLKLLLCYNNRLSTLDVSNLTQLTELNCLNNQISSLDVSKLTQLTTLGCSNNQLSSLDVSNLTQLRELGCSGNHLTVLDLTGFRGFIGFGASGQTRVLTFTEISSGYTANIAFSDGTTFDNTALSYNNGVLTSTSKAVTSSNFISPTGLSGYELSGTLTMTYPDSPSVIAGEEEPAGADGKGAISLSLAMPTDATLTGSFDIQFPAGMTLDQDLTVLSAGLSGLSITPKENNIWQIQIGNNGLRSAAAVEYRKIIDIAYKADKTVANGEYEALITNLDFTLSDETKIQEASLPVTITVDNTITGISELQSETLAYLNNGMLYIQSPVAETVQVHSTSGVFLYNFTKPAGSVSYPVEVPKGSVMIVKGSSGWVKKIVKK